MEVTVDHLEDLLQGVVDLCTSHVSTDSRNGSLGLLNKPVNSGHPTTFFENLKAAVIT
jgi:hypothetical protein